MDSRAYHGDRLLAHTELGSWRAEALVLLAELSVDRVAELLREALREATSPRSSR